MNSALLYLGFFDQVAAGVGLKQSFDDLPMTVLAGPHEAGPALHCYRTSGTVW